MIEDINASHVMQITTGDRQARVMLRRVDVVVVVESTMDNMPITLIVAPSISHEPIRTKEPYAVVVKKWLDATDESMATLGVT